MDLAAVEDDIVAKLTTVISDTNIDIRSWPNDPAFFQSLKQGGAILVRYAGSDYLPPEPNRQKKVIQDRSPQWNIDIIQKSLKKFKAHQGIYTLIESIRAALTGYTITGLSDAGVMWPISDNFTEEAAGTYVYTLVYTFTFPEAEA